MIDRSVVDNVIESSNARIVDVISDFVSLKRRGANYVGCCPFHNEKTGSFHVSPAKGIFKCFGCGKAGNALKFVQEHEHLDFVEAVKYLGNKLGIVVEDKELTPEMQQMRNERESMMAVTDFAKEQFIRNLWETDEGQSVALPYFRERGFRDDIIRKFHLGYSLQKRDAFTSTALTNGFVMEYLTKTGLTISNEKYTNDRFAGRVMFPIHSVSGRVVAFGGRVMQTGAKTAKYLNSPESELYHKSDIVYGIFHAKGEIIRQDMCYLVEGYTDVISMHQAGIVNVVASSGTSLTTNQIHLIQRFTNNITVLYDGDNAGIKASLRGIDMILSQGMNVNVLLLPDGEDPDSFARSHTADEFVEYVKAHQTNFIKFKASLLADDAKNDPLKKSELINDIVASISEVSDMVLRRLYIRECSQIMDIDEATLFGVLEQKLVLTATQRRTEYINAQRREAAGAPVGATANQPVQQPDDPFLPPIAQLQPTPQPAVKTNTNPYANEENVVLRFFVRYLDKPMFSGTPRQTTVGEYVISSLAEDEMVSLDPVFNKMLQLYIDAPERTKLTPDFFTNMADPDISTLAANYLSEDRKLSEMHSRYATVLEEEQMLDSLVVRTLDQLRLRKILVTIDQLSAQLKQAEAANEPEEKILEIMNQLALWSKMKKMMSTTLGGLSVI